jgi:hypothetical protein
MSGKRFVLLVLSLLLCFSGNTHAILIDFEGVATSGSQTTENNSTLTFNGFNVFIPHGHIEGRPFNQPPRADSGSDWLLYDHGLNGVNNQQDTTNMPFVITEENGNPFSIQRFQVSESVDFLTPNTVLTVSGHYQSGGTVSTTFTTDNAFGFETIRFPPDWQNLESVEFVDRISDFKDGKLGFDNILVNEPNPTPPAAIPEPATLLLFGMGLVGFSGFILKRKMK